MCIRDRGSTGEKPDWTHAPVAFEARGITDQNNYVRDISFQVRQGEIVGFSGLVGAGRTELMRAIFNVDPRSGGQVLIDGQEITGRSIKASVAAGLGFVPEDRKTEGLIQELSVLKNVGLAKLAARGGAVLNRRAEEADCNEMVRRMEIKTANIDLLVKNLSGGNQQKVLLAKWILLDPKVLIIDEMCIRDRSNAATRTSVLPAASRADTAPMVGSSEWQKMAPRLG